jgi:hypothetical protein
VPPLSTRLFLRMGATPYRCEFCRCNFASFRRCKEKFSWRKRRQAIADANLAAQANQTQSSEQPELVFEEQVPLVEGQAPIQREPETSGQGRSSS